MADLELNITTEEEIKITLSPKTRAGNPALIQEGTLLIESSGGDATIEMIEGVSDAFYLVSGTPGSTVFNISADADPGDGIQPIAAQVLLVVEAATAVTLGISASEPELK